MKENDGIVSQVKDWSWHGVESNTSPFLSTSVDNSLYWETSNLVFDATVLGVSERARTGFFGWEEVTWSKSEEQSYS